MKYQLDVSPAAQAEIKRLPGHIRQQVRRVIKQLADNPRPAHTKVLDFKLAGAEPRRLRLSNWRIVYAGDRLTITMTYLSCSVTYRERCYTTRTGLMRSYTV